MCMLLLKLYDAFTAPEIWVENCRRNLKPLHEKQNKRKPKVVKRFNSFNTV